MTLVFILLINLYCYSKQCAMMSHLCNRCVREFLILARTWFTFGLPSKTGCDTILKLFSLAFLEPPMARASRNIYFHKRLTASENLFSIGGSVKTTTSDFHWWSSWENRQCKSLWMKKKKSDGDQMMNRPLQKVCLVVPLIMHILPLIRMLGKVRLSMWIKMIFVDSTLILTRKIRPY